MNHQYPTGASSQLNYILGRNKWKNSIRNAQIYSSFANVGSGQRICNCILLYPLEPRSLHKACDEPHEPNRLVCCSNQLMQSELASMYTIKGTTDLKYYVNQAVTSTHSARTASLQLKRKPLTLSQRRRKWRPTASALTHLSLKYKKRGNRQ